VWIIIPGLLLGCDLINSNSESTVNDWDGVAVPLAIFDSYLPENSTFARLYMDVGTTPLQELKPLQQQTVRTDNSQSTVTFSGIGVPAGQHIFTITFVNNSETFGEIELARADGEPVDLVPGPNPILNFTGVYTFTDSDGDQISNLNELIAGSPPDDDVCVLGVSLIGRCTLDI